MAKFGVIISNRSFFPDHLVKTAREKLLQSLTAWGHTAITLSPEETKLGEVMTYEEAKKCAALFREHAEEIDGIMQLLRRYLHECIDTMERDGNRLRFLGDLSVLDDDLKELIRETNEISARIEGFQANVCLNYGGRDEIVHAARAFARDCAAGEKRSDALTEEIFSQYLYSNGLPDPELLIRPGGEKRISNYLLWQCAYSEFYFCDTLWPDFDEREFDKALIAYQHRERRFGGVKP